MHSRRIPQEIYDEILANIRHDEDTLRSCSLVCHAWLPRARHHLFHSISLDPSSCSHFEALAQSCPEFAPLVRVLELRGRVSTRRGWWDPENGSPANLAWPTLPGRGMQNNPSRRDSDVLETLSWLRDTFTSSSHGPPGTIKLPNVRSLRLDEVTFDTDTVAFLWAAFPRIESLTLNGCSAMAFASLEDLLQSFQQLKSLHLLSVEWLPSQYSGSTHPSTLSASTPRLSLAHLEFTRDIFVQPVFAWLLRASAHRTIRSLKCSIATQTSANALRSFLEASGPTLQQFSVTLSESRDPTAILETTQFDLSPCTGVERLALQCSSRGSMSEHNSLSWVLILLSKVCSPCLRDLHISIASTQLARLNLEGLDVVLAKTCYGSLRSLRFVFNGDTGRTAMGGTVERALRERLSTAHSHGIIQVEYA
ncbi:hypothetical protein C8T65DRAFT_738790 [Cerioporus squamosus]|nr:hypothetical protein C8T65DRAFT_738790 [Cerioporus squamosus]